MMIVAAVDAGTLLNVIWVSMASGIAVTTIFSLVILAGGRSASARRQGNRAAALAYSGLTTVLVLGFGAVVAAGVNIMLSK